MADVVETSYCDYTVDGRTGEVHVRTVTNTTHNGKSYEDVHRRPIYPGADISGEAPELQALIRAVWTPAKVKAWTEGFAKEQEAHRAHRQELLDLVKNTEGEIEQREKLVQERRIKLHAAEAEIEELAQKLDKRIHALAAQDAELGNRETLVAEHAMVKAKREELKTNLAEVQRFQKEELEPAQRALAERANSYNAMVSELDVREKALADRAEALAKIAKSLKA